MQKNNLTIQTRLKSLILALFVLISSISIPKASIYAADKTSVLQDNGHIVVDMIVNGQPLDNGSKLDVDSSIDVVMNINIPVENDYPYPAGGVIELNDTATVKLAKGLTFAGGYMPLPNLTYTDVDGKMLELATDVYLVQRPDGWIYLNMNFNGKDAKYIFDNEQDIHITLFATLNIDTQDIDPNAGEEIEVVIMERIYKLNLNEPIVNITKDAKFIHDDPSYKRIIEWTVEVSSSSGFLDGYTFKDDLENVGKYVDDSFEVSYGNPAIPASPAAIVQKDGDVISYKFPKSSVSPATIKFKTYMTDREFMATTNPSATSSQYKATEITNTAKLFKDNAEKAKVSKTVVWKPTWATKGLKNNTNYVRIANGPGTDDDDYDITYVIEVNTENATLKNVKIEDKINDIFPTNSFGHKLSEYNLIFQKAVIKRYDKSASTYTQDPDITTYPAGGEFLIGDIDAKIEFEITGRVNKGVDPQFFSSPKIYTNRASVYWDNNEGIKVFVARNSTVGSYGVTKTTVREPQYALTETNIGTQGRIPYANQEIKWKVDVPKGNGDPQSRTYDIMVFDNKVNTSNFNQLRLSDGTDSVNGIKLTDIKPTYITKNKYIEGSFETSSSTIYIDKIEKLYLDGKYAGDLLIVGGFPNVDAAAQRSYTYRTYLTDTNVIMNPDGSYVGIAGSSSGANFYYHNRIYIAKGSTLLDAISYTPRFISRLIQKSALSATDAQAYLNSPTAENANKTAEVQAKNIFNYSTKSAVYKLNVNAGGIKNVGDLVVNEDIPKGWVLKGYRIFEGESELKSDINITYSSPITSSVELSKKTNANVVAQKDVLSGTGSYSSSLVDIKYDTTTDPDKHNLEFRFINIDKPYLIMLELAPTDETFKTYAEASSLSTIVNTARVSLKNNPSINPGLNHDETKSLSEGEAITIQPQVISKQHKYDPANPGVLKWNIDYIPYDGVVKPETGSKIELVDELVYGLEVRESNTGGLLYNNDDGSANFEVYKLTIKADGSVQEASSAMAIKAEEYVSYDKTTKQLKFNIPNNDYTSAYRFYYTTDIVGELNRGVENKVTLTKSNITKNYTPPTSNQHKIQQVDIDASMRKISFLDIVKTDDKGDALSGAEFTLTGISGTPTAAINKVYKTDSQGNINIKLNVGGDFILKETKAPSGYVADTKVYNINVKSNAAGTQLVNSVDDGEYKNKNQITVVNKADVAPPPTPPSITTGPVLVATDATLRVSKKVEGDYDDRAFRFTVKLNDISGTSINKVYRYDLYRGGSLVIENFGQTSYDTGIGTSVAVFALKDNESIVIKNLEKDIRYTIVEDDYTSSYTLERIEASSTSSDMLNNKSIRQFSSVTIESTSSAVMFVSKRVASSSGGSSPTTPATPVPTTPSTGGTGSSGSTEKPEKSTPPPATPVTQVPTTPTTPVPTTPATPATPVPTTPVTPITPTTPVPPSDSTGDTIYDIPSYTFNNIPDPSDPDSPDTIILIDDDGVPLGTYKKQENTDGSIEYVLIEDSVPLAFAALPKTGQENSMKMLILGLGIIAFAFFIKRRKK